MSEEALHQTIHDYLRDKLTISVDMVWNGDYPHDKQVPRVTIYLDGKEITQATAY